jgi:Rrf2 family iron-sulfur cluster assembly transcriptional regulator
MRLTTKGRFAVTAMIDLALHHGSGPVTLAEISGRQKISLSYLEQLFGKLRRHQLVESVRGPGGGYCLAKDLAAVSVADIILAVDEPIDATQCGGKENCRDEQKCLTHDLWAALNDRIFDYLGSVSLRQLVENEKAREAAKAAGVAQVHDMREPGKRGSTPVPHEQSAAIHRR